MAVAEARAGRGAPLVCCLRQELLEQKSGSSAAALAILEAETKARLADLEASLASNKVRTWPDD